ncbi:MAG: hypothetical protein MSC30_08735 [Gaiellaceae bacterium MAG52_C11]|nr:hypothetical protein [Candidatus Gaiellasilicea maunaloa]
MRGSAMTAAIRKVLAERKDEYDPHLKRDSGREARPIRASIAQELPRLGRVSVLAGV